MEGPIQHRCSDHMVTEDLPPLPVGLVRGEDRRGLLIPPGDQTEETLGAFAVEGQISHLIDDQEMKLRERLNPLFKFVLPEAPGRQHSFNVANGIFNLPFGLGTVGFAEPGNDVFAHSILPRVYKEKLIRFCPLPTNILLMQPA